MTGVSPLLKPGDLAELLQVPVSHVYRLARDGRLPSVRIGERYVRFERTAIERWISEKQATAK